MQPVKIIAARAMPFALLIFACVTANVMAQVDQPSILNKQQHLNSQTFWDNRDWDWYAENIPFFECPDADITTTYYYRWELLTKHLTYGSPNTGYVFTEFIDRPFGRELMVRSVVPLDTNCMKPAGCDSHM